MRASSHRLSLPLSFPSDISTISTAGRNTNNRSDIDRVGAFSRPHQSDNHQLWAKHRRTRSDSAEVAGRRSEKPRVSGNVLPVPGNPSQPQSSMHAFFSYSLPLATISPISSSSRRSPTLSRCNLASAFWEVGPRFCCLSPACHLLAGMSPRPSPPQPTTPCSCHSIRRPGR